MERLTDKSKENCSKLKEKSLSEMEKEVVFEFNEDVTSLEYAHTPADNVAVIRNMTIERGEALRKIMDDASNYIAGQYKSDHPEALLLPITYAFITPENAGIDILTECNRIGVVYMPENQWELELRELYRLLKETKGGE